MFIFAGVRVTRFQLGAWAVAAFRFVYSLETALSTAIAQSKSIPICFRILVGHVFVC